VRGSYAGFAPNRDAQLRVVEKHRSHAYKLDPTLVPLDLLTQAREAWDTAVDMSRRVGVRNSQVTVLAPTGTIAFMMDCDTTGIEPDIALVKYKKLVGGGVLKIVNQSVPRALRRLGYDSREVQEIVEWLDEQETIEGAMHLRPEHLAVFDCAFKPAKGSRSIQYMGHIRMMAAVQPFISGAISKTINMPEEATVEEITSAYTEAWRLGLKAVAIYRDGCKRTQPLNTKREERPKAAAPAVQPASVPFPVRRRLGADCPSVRHKFEIAGHEGYIHIGFYEDGSPGEIFIKMAKEGSTVSGLMDTIATLTSMALQYGVPLAVLVNKFGHVRFEPSGFTKNPEIPLAKSLTDYIFRFLGNRFLEGEHRADAPDATHAPALSAPAAPSPEPVREPEAHDGVVDLGRHGMQTIKPQADAPSCPDCGALMIRNGSCYKCLNCGATSGCS